MKNTKLETVRQLFRNRSHRNLALPIVLLVVAGLNAFAFSQTWSQLGPSSRHSHTSVYDPVGNKMIIFGGNATATNTGLNDVWLGQISTNTNDGFQQLFPIGTPPQGRYGHVATYDSTNDLMMVFGGALGSPTPCVNDVWILAGASGRNGIPSWSQESVLGTAPAARVYAAGAYDPNTNSMIVFGGSDCVSGYFNDVWVVSNANGQSGTPVWTQLSASGTPPAARESASAIYDSVNNVLTIYAGDAGGAPFGDVWILSNANGSGGTPVWTQLNPSGTPPEARTGHTAIYDSVDNLMTIFGGANGSTTLTDAWVLTGPNGIGNPSWNMIKTLGTAPSVAYHSAVYNQALNQMYVFAGSSSANKLGTNSHIFLLTSGNGIVTGQGIRWYLGGPPVRYSSAMFYDSTTNALFFFGGQHAKTNLDFEDYWESTNILGSTNLTWILPKPKGVYPKARFGHTGLYDSSSNHFMVFGGATGYPAPCVNDYHILQFANLKGGTATWSTITAAGTLPSPRTLHTSVYDSATNRIIIFGGYDCNATYFNDVWVLANANDVTGTPTWSQLHPSGTAPPAREMASAVYDPTTNTMIVYAGDAGHNPFSDIWLLSNANGMGGTPAWTQLHPSGTAPLARTGQSAIYDPSSNHMTIYGGYASKTIFSDVWILSSANGQGGTPAWTQGVSGQPRRWQNSVYDAGSNSMITYGGSTYYNPLNPSSDIWIMTDANGVQ